MPKARLEFVISYDNQQIKIHIQSKEAVFPEHVQDLQEDCSSTFDVSLMMLRNMFGDVRVRVAKSSLIVDVCDDL